MWVGGDFNCLRTSKFMKELEEMLPYILEGTGKEMRAGGKARTIDFVLCSLPISKETHSKALASLSDHEPVLSSLTVRTQKLAKTKPDSSVTCRMILQYVAEDTTTGPFNAWTKILEGSRLRSNTLQPRNSQEHPISEDYQEYLREYLERY